MSDPWTQPDLGESVVLIGESKSWISPDNQLLNVVQHAGESINIQIQTLDQIETHELVELNLNDVEQPLPKEIALAEITQESQPANLEEKNPSAKVHQDTAVKCPVCQLQLKNQKNLRSHMTTHGGEKKFHCTICPKSFLRSNQLKSHQKVHTGERPFECDICFKSFSQSSNFLVHKNTHVDIPIDLTLPFKCDICERTFSQQLYLRTHMKVHTDRDPMRCKLCRRKYERQEDLDQHTKEHVALKLFRCLECGKEFERYINLKNHRFTHNGLKPYPCKICGKPFAHTTSLSVHVRTHTGEKPYQCSKCDNSFSQWANYHRHLATHDTKPTYKCDYCEKTFKKTSSLKSHLRTHEENRKQYVCAYCGKGFVKRGTIKKHFRSHFGKCSICGENVGRGKEYSEHMRIVHRRKKLKCEICSARFSSVHEIREHMDTAHAPIGEKLYKCDECDLFEDEFALDAHVRQAHPAYRLHGCPHCRMDFAHTDLLLQHMKEHLGQKQCEQCGKMFKKYGLYKRHQCIRAKYMREIEERKLEEERRRLMAEATLPDVVVDGTDSEMTNADAQSQVEASAAENDGLDESQISSDIESFLSSTMVKTEFQTISIYAQETSPTINESNEEQTHVPVDILQMDDLDDLALTEDDKLLTVLKEEDNKGKSEEIFFENIQGFDDSDADPDFQPDYDGDVRGHSDSEDDEPVSSIPVKREPNLTTEPDPCFMCAVCGRSFTSSKRLQVHSQSHGERKFQCDQCPMSFVRSTELKTHLRSHSNERPFQCEICSKCFTQSSALYTHHRVHSGERPFSCRVCQKRFKQSSARKRHEALHTGEKPFMCVVCGKSFANSDGLQIHTKVHEKTRDPQPKERAVRSPKPIRVKPAKPEPVLGPNGYYGDLPFPCEVCRKTFAKACTLWVHSKIHTGEKNFKCDQCPKAFAQGANLKRHKMSHTGKRPYQCFDCTKWFAKQETLDAHMELHAEESRRKAVTVFQVHGIPDVSAILMRKPGGEVPLAPPM